MRLLSAFPVQCTRPFTKPLTYPYWGYLYSTPDGYRRADLPPKIARQFVSNYGIPEYPVYYFSQEDGNPHLCPIGECGQYFLGHTIKTHLQECHKNINSRNRDLIQCTSKSNESSRCSPENKVQGRYFEKHFREVHLDQHFLCPFCKGRQRRMSQFGEHFEKCKRLQWARDKRGTVAIEWMLTLELAM